MSYILLDCIFACKVHASASKKVVVLEIIFWKKVDRSFLKIPMLWYEWCWRRSTIFHASPTFNIKICWRYIFQLYFSLLFPLPSSFRFAAWFSYANAKCAVGQCTNFWYLYQMPPKYLLFCISYHCTFIKE